MSDNKKPMQSRVLVFVAAAILTWFTFNLLFPTSEVVSQQYTHFTKNLDRVDEIYLKGDQASFLYSLKGDDIIHESVFPPGKVVPILDELQAQGAAIGVEAPPKPVGTGQMIVMSIIPVFILIGALIWISKRNGAGATAGLGSNPANLINPEDNKTTLDDVAGNPGDLSLIHI